MGTNAIHRSIDKRNLDIDFLRGTSILYIVGFWHLLNYTNVFPHYNNIVTYRITWIILGTFVFISGYFTGKRRIEFKKGILKSFYLNRVLRIYPLYFISLATFTYLDLSDFETSLKAALILSMFLKPAPFTLWFITMLMVFFTISPFLIWACQTGKMAQMVIVYMILFVILMSNAKVAKFLDVRIIMYLPAFVFGLYVASNEIKLSNKKTHLLIAFIAGGLISFISNTPYIQLNWLYATLLVTVAPYFLFRLFRKYGFWLKKISGPILILSYSSYCMYLFHRPLYMVFINQYYPHESAYQLIYLWGICLPSIIVLSYGIQKLYDKTLQLMTDQFSSV